MMKALWRWLEIHLCDHVFVADTQLTIVKCKKCGRKYWYRIEDIYNRKGGAK